MRAAAILAGAWAVVVVAVTQAAAGQETTFDKSVLPKLFEEIDRRGTPGDYFQQCPVDIWLKATAIGDSILPAVAIDYEHCEQDVLACAKLCFDRRSGDACFETARVIQDNTPADQQTETEAMFAQACATGSAGGCTNRGAGILQNQLPDKLRGNSDEAQRCTYRTFKLTCDESDPWGCTMLGMALHYGEGASKNEAAALAAYNKSCEIDSDFTACQYAKAAMRTLQSH